MNVSDSPRSDVHPFDPFHFTHQRPPAVRYGQEARLLRYHFRLALGRVKDVREGARLLVQLGDGFGGRLYFRCGLRKGLVVARAASDPSATTIPGTCTDKEMGENPRWSKTHM